VSEYVNVSHFHSSHATCGELRRVKIAPQTVKFAPQSVIFPPQTKRERIPFSHHLTSILIRRSRKSVWDEWKGFRYYRHTHTHTHTLHFILLLLLYTYTYKLRERDQVGGGGRVILLTFHEGPSRRRPFSSSSSSLSPPPAPPSSSSSSSSFSSSSTSPQTTDFIEDERLFGGVLDFPVSRLLLPQVLELHIYHMCFLSVCCAHTHTHTHTYTHTHTHTQPLLIYNIVRMICI
jgi:hypothetical protein